MRKVSLVVITIVLLSIFTPFIQTFGEEERVGGTQAAVVDSLVMSLTEILNDPALRAKLDEGLISSIKYNIERLRSKTETPHYDEVPTSGFCLIIYTVKKTTIYDIRKLKEMAKFNWGEMLRMSVPIPDSLIHNLLNTNKLPATVSLKDLPKIVRNPLVHFLIQIIRLHQGYTLTLPPRTESEIRAAKEYSERIKAEYIREEEERLKTIKPEEKLSELLRKILKEKGKSDTVNVSVVLVREINPEIESKLSKLGFKLEKKEDDVILDGWIRVDQVLKLANYYRIKALKAGKLERIRNLEEQLKKMPPEEKYSKALKDTLNLLTSIDTIYVKLILTRKLTPEVVREINRLGFRLDKKEDNGRVLLGSVVVGQLRDLARYLRIRHVRTKQEGSYEIIKVKTSPEPNQLELQ